MGMRGGGCCVDAGMTPTIARGWFIYSCMAAVAAVMLLGSVLGVRYVVNQPRDVVECSVTVMQSELAARTVAWEVRNPWQCHRSDLGALYDD